MQPLRTPKALTRQRTRVKGDVDGMTPVRRQQTGCDSAGMCP